MSFRRLTTSIVFLAVFAMAVRVSTDTDTWWHLRAGWWMVEHGQILREDLFSLTRMGQPWIYPGWLAQIALYGAFAGLGYAGLNLLTAAAVVAAFAFVWRELEGPGLLRAFVLLLAAMTSAVYWSARPQIFSFLLSAVCLWALEGARKGSGKRILILPAVMALWVNLHGGFAIGFLLIGVYAAGEGIELLLGVALKQSSLAAAWRAHRASLLRLGGVLGACALAACLNPNGPAMLLYPFKTVSIGVLQDYIQEWQSPNFHHLEPQPFVWMLFLTAMAMAASSRRKAPVEWLGLFGFAYLGLVAGRNIAVFALVAAPTLSRHAESALAPIARSVAKGPQVPERWARVINAILLSLAVVAAAAKVSIPLATSVNVTALEERLPVAAVSYIQTERPPGALFNSYNWGGYILWALYPDHPSFVDGRTDLFDDEILRQYLTAWRAGEGWEEVLDRWDIRLVLLEPDAPLVRALESAGWARGYADEHAVVLLRGEGP
ncbi:MAG: hypothetical protein A2Y93_11610 [Chloroflexi bacterium RBG_13_68_17]|nr:MAG: hypothetical protein A2Y93_11610 [Chloroflexi bacterium RBG_13_68_17]